MDLLVFGRSAGDHIVAAGTATGLDSTAVDAAITTQLISANLVEQDGLVRLSPRGERWGSAVQAARQRKEPARRQYKELVEAVRDVMARRTDGRPKYAEPIKAFEPHTPLQLCGRDIYVREGCYNCHSQMIRPFRSETLRYGH